MQLIAEYTEHVTVRRTPGEVLDDLHEVCSKSTPLSVLGAARLPLKVNDWSSVQLGKTAFLHSSAPPHWWDEYIAIARHQHDPGLMMAQWSLIGFTWTEGLRMLDPIGCDRWAFELALKHRMRDGLTCSVGRRWLVAFWSRQPLTGVLLLPARIILFAAASFAALRLEQLVEPDPQRVGELNRITPRELAVLRSVAMGRQCQETARALGIGEETVRSHLKKAQGKLGARNRPHAVAEAMRQPLIP
jgi:LuxR family quorum sensing-dependent transcriptional regulator